MSATPPLPPLDVAETLESLDELCVGLASLAYSHPHHEGHYERAVKLRRALAAALPALQAENELLMRKLEQARQELSAEIIDAARRYDDSVQFLQNRTVALQSRVAELERENAELQERCRVKVTFNPDTGTR